MPKYLRAGCVVAFALAGCTGDAGSVKPSTSAGTQMIKLSTDPSQTVIKPTSFGKKVELNGQYESAAIARRNADGSITIECHDEQHAAESFMQGGGHVHAKLEVQ